LGGLFQVHSSPPHFTPAPARRPPPAPIVGLGQVAFADPPRPVCSIAIALSLSPHKPAADALPPLCCASVEQQLRSPLGFVGSLPACFSV